MPKKSKRKQKLGENKTVSTIENDVTMNDLRKEYFNKKKHSSNRLTTNSVISINQSLEEQLPKVASKPKKNKDCLIF